MNDAYTESSIHMQIPSEIDLARLRQKARISQSDMAERLGLSQSQVSRYEQDPEEVPYRVIRKWFALCGFVSSVQGLNVGQPFTEIQGRMKLLLDYAQTEPDAPEVYIDKTPVADAQAFIRSAQAIARKPRVGLCGVTSSGKSRLGNIILGLDRLPAGFDPTTSTICLIRHISDKPVWQTEDVWMMRRGFDVNLADDEDHCKALRLISGGYESLRQYGTFSGSGFNHDSHVAVIYIDSPLLMGCDLLDFPGYQSPSGQTERSELGQQLIDVLIYTSPAHDFLNQADINYLGALLRHLPIYSALHGNIEPLRNLMVVATKADTIEKDRGAHLLDRGSMYVFHNLSHVFTGISRITNSQIRQEDLRRRFFTFTAVDVNMRTELTGVESDLVDLLSNTLPQCLLDQMNSHILNAKLLGNHKCDMRINRLRLVKRNREAFHAALNAIQADELVRADERTTQLQNINTLIDKFSVECRANLINNFKSTYTVEFIQESISNHFGENKKEAQTLAVYHLLHLIHKTNEFDVKDKCYRLFSEINLLLDVYDFPVKKQKIMQAIWPFSAFGSFGSECHKPLASVALEAWMISNNFASTSYLCNQFSTDNANIYRKCMGETVASTEILDPIWISTINRELQYSFLLDDSWQQKLAKRIHKQIQKDEVEKTVANALDDFWLSTKSIINAAVDKVEADYKENLEDMKNLALSTELELFELDYSFSQDIRDFFGGFPWKSIRIRRGSNPGNTLA